MKSRCWGSSLVLSALLAGATGISPGAAREERAALAPSPMRTVVGRWKTSLLVAPNGKPYPVDPDAGHIVPPLQELILEQQGERVTGVLKPTAPSSKGLEGWNIEIQQGSFRDGELTFTLKSEGPNGRIVGGGSLIGNTLHGWIGVGTGQDGGGSWIWSAERIPDRSNSDPDGSVTGRWVAEPFDLPSPLARDAEGRPVQPSVPFRPELTLKQDGENVTGFLNAPYIDDEDRLQTGIRVSKGTFREGRLILTLDFQRRGRLPNVLKYEAFLKGDALTGSHRAIELDSVIESNWSARRLSLPPESDTAAFGADTAATGSWEVTLPDREGRLLRRKMLLAQNGSYVEGILKAPEAGDTVLAPVQYFQGRLKNGELTFQTDARRNESPVLPLEHRVTVKGDTLKGSTTLPAEGDASRTVTWSGTRIPAPPDGPGGTKPFIGSRKGQRLRIDRAPAPARP